MAGTEVFSLRCEHCNKQKKVTDFLKCQFTKTGHEVWCKKCKSENVFDKESLRNYLELNNTSFNEVLWDICIKWAREKLNIKFSYSKELPPDVEQNLFKKTIAQYYKQKNLPQYASFSSESNLVKVGHKMVDRNLELKWGSGYEPDDYNRLEDFYMDMKKSYEIETKSHEDYLRKICIVSVKMDKALERDNIDDFKKLSDVYDKLMHSAKFTAVQRSASDRTGGLNTFSEWFEMAEKEGFVPKFHNSEPMDIVDKTEKNIMNFTKTLILGDTNIATLIEESITKISDKDDEDSPEGSQYDEEYYIDLADEDDVISDE